MLVRSAFRFVDVYNFIAQTVIEQKSVAAMQHELQMLLKFRGRMATTVGFTLSRHVAF